MYKLIELFNQLNFCRPLFAFIKNGLFHFITLSKMAFIDDFCSIQKCHYEGFLLYQKPSLSAFTKNGLFLLIALLKGAFISLY